MVVEEKRRKPSTRATRPLLRTSMYRTSNHASPSTLISRSLAAARPRVHTHRRFASQKPQGVRLEDYRFDPRPSWVYTMSTTLRLVLIPSARSRSLHAYSELTLRAGALIYAVFFADFGEKEHVFMPVRRSQFPFRLRIMMLRGVFASA